LDKRLRRWAAAGRSHLKTTFRRSAEEDLEGIERMRRN
jgi:hypothetical protein